MRLVFTHRSGQKAIEKVCGRNDLGWNPELIIHFSGESRSGGMIVVSLGLPILALAVACGLWKFANLKKGDLSEPRANRLTIGVQIICGDCSGDAEIPLKTSIDRRGNW